jgi:hypothetical protein
MQRYDHLQMDWVLQLPSARSSTLQNSTPKHRSSMFEYRYCSRLRTTRLFWAHTRISLSLFSTSSPLDASNAVLLGVVRTPLKVRSSMTLAAVRVGCCLETELRHKVR